MFSPVNSDTRLADRWSSLTFWWKRFAHLVTIVYDGALGCKVLHELCLDLFAK